MMRNLYKMFFLSCAACILFSGVMLAQSTAGSGSGDTQQAGQPNSQNAQGQMRGQQRRRMAMLAQRLNLSDDQKRQWMQIMRETGQKVKTLRADQSLSDEQRQAQLKQIRKEQREQVFAILSPEQQDELKKFWAEQRQKQKQQSDNASGDKPAPVMAGTPSDDPNELDDLFADMTPDPDPAPAQTPAKKPHH